MKAIEKLAISALIIVFAASLVMAVPYLYKNYFNKFGNYMGKGVGDNNILNSEISGVMENINTILENKDYGILVIKENGTFYYYPAEHDFFEVNSRNAFYYKGLWYIPRDEIRFTVTKKVFKTPDKKPDYKDYEFFYSFDYSAEENSLGFDYKLFTEVDNDLTKNEPDKFHLRNETIELFLKNKNNEIVN